MQLRKEDKMHEIRGVTILQSRNSQNNGPSSVQLFPHRTQFSLHFSPEERISFTLQQNILVIHCLQGSFYELDLLTHGFAGPALQRAGNILETCLASFSMLNEDMFGAKSFRYRDFATAITAAS